MEILRLKLSKALKVRGPQESIRLGLVANSLLFDRRRFEGDWCWRYIEWKQAGRQCG